MKWLRRYLDEKEPTLREFAKAVRSLEERELEAGGRTQRAALPLAFDRTDEQSYEPPGMKRARRSGPSIGFESCEELHA